ncbi:MAG: LysR family transcriptional regulator [Acidobacteriaceae bacterium]|nr:LysR family transcriptional regulator [Acidobacteriaceae bacterium]
MPDRLTEMAVFVKAAETGSFAAASSKLGMSAQVVGKHISSLEERLGAKLITRTTRRQSLTELGAVFYERCKAILAEAQAAEDLASGLTARPRGRIRVTAPVNFGTLNLMGLVCRYMAKQPEVQIEVQLDDRVVDLVSEHVELAIRIGPLSDSTFIAKPLVGHSLIPFASPKYLDAHGSPEQPSDLLSHTCLGYTYVSRPPMKEWVFSKGSQIETVQVNGRLQTNNCEALREAALHGCGIVLLPEYSARNHIDSGGLVRVLPEWDGPSRPMHILFAPDRLMTPKLRSFVDAVVDEFGPKRNSKDVYSRSRCSSDAGFTM